MAEIKWDDGTTEQIGSSAIQWDDGTTEAISAPVSTPGRWEKIKREFTTPTPEEVAGRSSDSHIPVLSLSSPLATFTETPGRIYRAGGQVAGMVNDAVGALVTNGIKAIYEATTPKEAQKAFEQTMKDVAASGPGQSMIDGLRAVSEAYRKFKGAFPEGAANLEATGNYLGIVPAAVAGKAVAGPIKKGAEAVVEAITPLRTVEKLDSLIDAAIEKGIKKGIRPTVVGKQNAAQVEKYFDNAKSAVRDIVESSPELPRSLEDFSKSVLDTRKKIYAQYHSMAQEAGGAGAAVDLAPIIKEMDALASNAKLRRVNADTADWLAQKSQEWKNLPSIIGPEEAEDMIASLNAATKAFWKNPNFNDTSRVVMSEGIAKQLRKATDEAIGAYQGPGYQDLKKRYGALKSIEKEVTDRATVDARKNIKGFFDIADIASAGEFAYGLTKMDPASMVAAASMRGMKNYIKRLNDPNRIVKDMFDETGRLMKIRNRLAPPVDPSVTPKLGPYVRSSEIDRMIGADAQMKRAIRGDLESGQYGSLLERAPAGPGPRRSALEEVLNAPDETLATDTGIVDAGLRISDEELQAARLANHLKALGGAETRIGQRAPYPDLGTATRVVNPDTMPYRGMLPSAEVKSGTTVGASYESEIKKILSIIADKTLSKEEKNRAILEYIKRNKR